MSDPHRWDKYDRTVPRPFTRARLVWFLAFRWFCVLSLAGFAVIVLSAALHSPTRANWTLFWLASIAWVFLASWSAWLSVLLIRKQRRVGRGRIGE